MIRDPKIEAIYAIHQNTWRGYPHCFRRQADCIYPQHPGEGSACFKCEHGIPQDRIDYGPKPNPELTPESHFLRLLSYGMARESKVFKTFYQMKSGGWTENKEEGDWKALNSHFPNKTCRVRYESYYVVNGEKITNYREAAEKWLAFEVSKYIIINIGNRLINLADKCLDCLYCPPDKRCILTGKIRKIRVNTKACKEHFKSKALNDITII
jgi:hypothetical protein